EISGDMKPSDLGDGSRPAYRGQAAFVEVMEVLPRLASQIAGNGLRHRTSLLHGHWRHSGQQAAGFIFQGRKVANHEHLGMSGEAEIAIDQDPAGAIGRGAKLLT